MRKIIAADAAEFARNAADIIHETVRRKPAAAIGLPSGNTPLDLYDEVARRCRDADIDLASVTAFAVDEWHGVPASHPATNASYFRTRVTQRIPLRALHIMDSAADDAEAECERFARLIEDGGGLDLVLLGIGRNGHIAFNEPGSSFDSLARRVQLARASREAYAGQFGSLEATPDFGLTLGIAELFAAREAVLLASGPDKASVVAEALEGPVSETLPASALRRHPAATVLLDREAAAGLASERD